MAIGLLDEVKVWITDEQQVAELEFCEAQEEFCKAAVLWHDKKQESHMERMTEAEVRLLNAFMAGSRKPIMLRAWAAYRRRLLYYHRRES